jgi:hypothetical protein
LSDVQENGVENSHMIGLLLSELKRDIQPSQIVKTRVLESQLMTIKEAEGNQQSMRGHMQDISGRSVVLGKVGRLPA